MMKIELSKELERLQNIVALEELKANYDKSEWHRIITDTEYNPSEAYQKAQALLNEEYTGTLEAKINNLGTITITETVGEHIGNIEVKRVIGTIFPTVQLPYSYVMGKKIGKKVARSILEKYGMEI